jgi:hypothetical protein
MANPLLDDNERLMPPVEYEARIRRALPEWQTHYTSDDYVDYTWHAPTVRLLTMRPRLRPPSADYEYPAWAHNALGGLPAAINPGIFLGGKTIAATLLDLLTEPTLLQQAQNEFREHTGGGIGGTKWTAPLLPKDFAPPVDRSTCAGPNTSKLRAARNGGFRPPPQARGPASRPDQRLTIAGPEKVFEPRLSALKPRDAPGAARRGTQVDSFPSNETPLLQHSQSARTFHIRHLVKDRRWHRSRPQPQYRRSHPSGRQSVRRSDMFRRPRFCSPYRPGTPTLLERRSLGYRRGRQSHETRDHSDLELVAGDWFHPCLRT